MVEPLPEAALTLTVAFAGHRSLPDGADLSAALERVFKAISESLDMVSESRAGQGETILQAHAAIWPTCTRPTAMRLLAGYAPGADQLAVRTWRRLELGRVHGLFPFADPDHPETFAWTDDPSDEKVRTQTSLKIDIAGTRDLDEVTILDGKASTAAEPYRHPHLEQGRWLSRWSDIIVVTWNGEVAEGPGGTGDIVALALASVQPVIWIDTSTPDLAAKVIMPSRLWRDATFREALITLRKPADSKLGDDRRPVVLLSTEAVERPIRARLRPPCLEAKTNAKKGLERKSSVDAEGSVDAKDALAGKNHQGGSGGHKRKERHAKTHDIETHSRRDYAKGSHFGHPVFEHLAHALAALWPMIYRVFGRPEPRVEGAVARSDTSALIRAQLEKAERHARTSGDLHRAGQFVLLALAVAAVFAGTIPAIFEDAKLFCVGAEWVIIGVAAGLHRLLVAITTNQRWSDARRLAERLRALDATWPLGFDVGDERSDPPSTWTEWYARAVRRAAGPPSAFLSQTYRERMGEAGREDIEGIVHGQCRYHKVSHRRAHNFHRTLHYVEVAATLVLLLGLPAFLFWALIEQPEKAVLHEFGNPLLMLSALVPAVAAACLGIEAKLGLTEVANRSDALKAQFQEILDEMENPKTREQREEELLRAAAILVIADVDRWRDASAHRIMATF